MRAENIPPFFKIFQKEQNKQKKNRISGKLDNLLKQCSIYGKNCKEKMTKAILNHLESDKFNKAFDEVLNSCPL